MITSFKFVLIDFELKIWFNGLTRLDEDFVRLDEDFVWLDEDFVWLDDDFIWLDDDFIWSDDDFKLLDILEFFNLITPCK